MGRSYVKKTAPKKYTPADLSAAVEACKNGMRLSQAAAHYNVPATTLWGRVLRRHGVKSQTGGRPTVIDFAAESYFANCLRIMERWGLGLSKKEVIITMSEYCRRKGIETPFRDGIPGDDWFIGFTRRHGLSLKKAQGVEVARKKAIDPFEIEKYFRILEEVIYEVPANRIYNIDETSFCLDPKRVKIVGEKNQPCHRVTNGPGRENISVLLGGNAAGEKLPPHFIFTGANLWSSWIPSEDSVFPNTTYSATANGWMETTVFHRWFQNNFLTQIGEARPVVLIFDGHKSHVSFELIELAIANNVVILKLPPHSTHKLQPMDLCVFSSLKMSFDVELTKWQRSHYNQKLSKADFAKLVSRVWSNMKIENLISGFKKAGIHPFNRNVIPASEYDPRQWKRFRDSNPTAAAAMVSNVSCTCQCANNTKFNTSITSASSAVPVTPAPSTCTIPINAPTLITPALPTCSPSLPMSAVLANTVVSEQSTSAHVQDDTNCTFEDLLLKKVSSSSAPRTKRKMICPGAEVITTAEMLQKMQDKKQEEINKSAKKELKAKNKKQKLDTSAQKLIVRECSVRLTRLPQDMISLC